MPPATTLPPPSHAPAPAAEPALLALRRATRTRHDRIEAVMELRRLRDVDHYGRVLQAFDAFLAPWEAGVAAALPQELTGWLRQRSRRGFLQRDLQALRLPRLASTVVAVTLPSAAAAFGSMYVLEGSALGGQVIARELGREGMGVDAGCAYFHGWGSGTAALWRDFRQLLEQQVGDAAQQRAEACTAACATFDALTALLQTVLHERPALA